MKSHIYAAVLAAIQVSISGCVTQSPYPRSSPSFPPPCEPLPISAIAVKFVQAGTQKYPPTKTTYIRRHKIVSHFPTRPPIVRSDDPPTRPYITVGKLYFGENWYSDENVDELMKKYVSEVGGDAVLTYEIFQTGAAGALGCKPGSYATIQLEVIRYTDR